MDQDFGFHIEWLPKEPQRYHGPRARMRDLFAHVDRRGPALSQAEVVGYIVGSYPEMRRAIRKLKFYEIPEPPRTLRFFILWCDFSASAREAFYELGEEIIRQTGWYPLVTGNRVFHHTRLLVDYLETGLRKAMNRSNIESLPGLGTFGSVARLAGGEGTSILVRSSTYDLVLDAGMEVGDVDPQALDPKRRKWLFVSHSHRDHTGGMDPFVMDTNFVISATPMTLNLWLRAISGYVNVPQYLPKNFFYRFAPMWYRARYMFSDGSSIEVFPTYHFPGSAGFRFTFADGKTLFYSGDMNVAASYVSGTKGIGPAVQGLGLGIPPTDYALLDSTFVGRKIGSTAGDNDEILRVVEQSLRAGRNHLLLTPPDDYGLFLFLYMYDALISSSRTVDTRLFVDSAILGQLEMIEWSLKRKRPGELDDALIRFLAKRSTLAESVRVYDVSVTTEANLGEYRQRGMPIVAILDGRRFETEGYLTPTSTRMLGGPDTDISLVGKGATTANKDDRGEGGARRVFDAGNWLLHSTEELLASRLLAEPGLFDQIYFFHNFDRRIDRFAKTLRERGYDRPIMHLPRVAARLTT